MKKHWIEIHETRPRGPMSFWVHRNIGGESWLTADEFDPPLQKPIPGRGYPEFMVEYDGFTFRFCSLAEMRECIDVLGQKLLPRSIDLSRKRTPHKGPNSHWLSRLPAKVKPWKYREKAVAYLEKAMAEFKATIA